MRGVMIITFIVFFLVVYTLVAPAALEGVGEGVKPHLPDTDLGNTGEGVIDNLYTAIFVHIPLIVMFGFSVVAVAWYIRRQLTVGRI